MSDVITPAHQSRFETAVRRRRPMPLSANHRLRHEALADESVYRVVDVSGSLVEVEVVRAPGLTPGTQLRITRRAAQAMQSETIRMRRGSHPRRRRSVIARLGLAR